MRNIEAGPVSRQNVIRVETGVIRLVPGLKREPELGQKLL